MIVLVTGGREYGSEPGEFDRLFDALSEINQQTPIKVLVHGYARGADSVAREWGEWRRDGVIPQDIRVMGFRAEWERLGKAAGHKRNARMVEWVKSRPGPSLVLACPGGRGTADCVSKAKAAGLTVKTLDEVLVERASGVRS